jgi:hypothetical protein
MSTNEMPDINLALGVLIVVLLLYEANHQRVVRTYSRKSVRVESSIDHQVYSVLQSANQQQAADLLAKVKSQVEQIRMKFRAHPDSVPEEFKVGVSRLLDLDIKLSELDSLAENTVAFNLNKKAIFMCLRNDPPTDKLADADVVLSVLLHELAHAMIVDTAPMTEGHTVHDANFKKHERYLHTVAASLALLSPSNIIGRKFCAIRIPSPDDAE